MFPWIERVPADHDVVLDYYLWHPGLPGDAETDQQEVHSMRQPSRLSALHTAPGGGRRRSRQRSWRAARSISPTARGEKTYEEEKLYRGLHPMMGKRLSLWRLNNFRIERLPSVEDVYLFHAIARDNPKDERLFACAEVRDMTPVRDEAGRIVQLPHLERMLAEALAGIRLFQSRRSPPRAPLLESDSPLRVASAHSEAG